jgi:hypothetical protein
VILNVMAPCAGTSNLKSLFPAATDLPARR